MTYNEFIQILKTLGREDLIPSLNGYEIFIEPFCRKYTDNKKQFAKFFIQHHECFEFQLQTLQYRQEQEYRQIREDLFEILDRQNKKTRQQVRRICLMITTQLEKKI